MPLTLHFNKSCHTTVVFQKLPFANECDLSRQPSDQNQIFGMQSNLGGLMQQNNLASTSDQVDAEIELVSDDGKVEVISVLLFKYQSFKMIKIWLQFLSFIEKISFLSDTKR